MQTQGRGRRGVGRAERACWHGTQLQFLMPETLQYDAWLCARRRVVSTRHWGARHAGGGPAQTEGGHSRDPQWQRRHIGEGARRQTRVKYAILRASSALYVLPLRAAATARTAGAGACHRDEGRPDGVGQERRGTATVSPPSRHAAGVRRARDHEATWRLGRSESAPVAAGQRPCARRLPEGRARRGARPRRTIASSSAASRPRRQPHLVVDAVGQRPRDSAAGNAFASDCPLLFAPAYYELSIHVCIPVYLLIRVLYELAVRRPLHVTCKSVANSSCFRNLARRTRCGSCDSTLGGARCVAATREGAAIQLALSWPLVCPLAPWQASQTCEAFFQKTF